MTTGKFIVLEGPDGSGKSTQCQRLKDVLTGEGHDVLLVREPGDTVLGEEVRKLVLEHRSDELDNRTEACLFMAARAQLVGQIIAPALKAGKTVISDRFLLSTLVYQGYLDGKIDEALFTMGRYVTEGAQPDLILVLDVTPDASAVRRTRELDRMEAKGRDYHLRVRDGYLYAVDHYGGAIVRIDTSDKDIDAVHQAVLQEVRHVLA